MSTYNRKTKRNSKRKFLGLLIVVVLSIAALFFFTDKPIKTLLTTAKAAPTLQLSNNNNSINAASPNTDVILVNKYNPVPNDYKVDLVELSNGQTVDRQIYPALQAMFDTARSQGIYPVVVSGYRTAEKQQFLMDEKIAAYTAEGFSSDKAIAKAKEWVATPGTSEHQLGLAIDINADGVNSSGDEVYDWLAKNAHIFGFICRYPANKADITGINYEPWHYRYVGIDDATKIYEQGLCLEEYLDTLN